LHASLIVQVTQADEKKFHQPALMTLKMVALAQLRKAFLNKGLTSTVSWISSPAKAKKESRKSGSQGKTGRKIRPIHRMGNCLKSGASPDA
jgi:hypothetical protein